jgi:hypothetical protein
MHEILHGAAVIPDGGIPPISAPTTDVTAQEICYDSFHNNDNG